MTSGANDEAPGSGGENPRGGPRRRCPRWMVILGLVVVVLGGLGWWLWPRTDSRFAGRWIEREGDPYEAIWTFKMDGTLDIYTFSRRAGGIKVHLPYRWFIVRDRIYYTPAATSVGHAISSVAGHVWNVVTDRAQTPNIIIQEVTPTSIVLRPVFPGPRDDAQLVRLRRLPDEIEN
ncbi:MAG TPA: hypothetical protein VM452_00405 [Caulifigura sp.]|nr:hypothetical protein [Caulifigura sp.]